MSDAHSAAVKRAAAIAGAMAGAGLLLTAVASRRKPAQDGSSKDARAAAKRLPRNAEALVPFVGRRVAAQVAADPVWTELCDRASEFAAVARDEFVELVDAVGAAVAFYDELQRGERRTALSTPRMYRRKLHAIIEAVRHMLAALDDAAPTSLAEFEEVAADIQRTHDDYALNVLLDARAAADSR